MNQKNQVLRKLFPFMCLLILALVLGSWAGPWASADDIPRSGTHQITDSQSIPIVASGDDATYIIEYDQFLTDTTDMYLETGSYTAHTAFLFKGINVPTGSYVQYMTMTYQISSQSEYFEVNEEDVRVAFLIGDDIFTINQANLATYDYNDFNNFRVDATYFSAWEGVTNKDEFGTIQPGGCYSDINVAMGTGYTGNVLVIITTTHSTRNLTILSYDSGGATPTLNVYASDGTYDSVPAGSTYVDTVSGYDVFADSGEYNATEFTESDVDVDTSGHSTISRGGNRAIFYAKDLFWTFYVTWEDDYGFETSSDGELWDGSFTELGTASGGPNTALFYDESTGYVHYVRATSSNFYYRVGTPEGNRTISWLTAEQTLERDSGLWGAYPSISVDSEGYAWIGGEIDVGVPDVPYITKNLYTNGTWEAEFFYRLDENDGNWRITSVPLKDGKVYVVYTKATVTNGVLWDDGWGTVEPDFMEYELDMTQAISMVVIENDVYLAYNTQDPWQLRLNIRVWGEGWSANESIIRADSWDYAEPSLTVDTSTGAIYCFYIDGDLEYVYYKKYLGGIWGEQVLFVDESDDDIYYPNHVGSSYMNYGGYIGVVYNTHMTSPKTLVFKALDVGAAVEAYYIVDPETGSIVETVEGTNYEEVLAVIAALVQEDDGVVGLPYNDGFWIMPESEGMILERDIWYEAVATGGDSGGSEFVNQIQYIYDVNGLWITFTWDKTSDSFIVDETQYARVDNSHSYGAATADPNVKAAVCRFLFTSLVGDAEGVDVYQRTQNTALNWTEWIPIKPNYFAIGTIPDAQNPTGSGGLNPEPYIPPTLDPNDPFSEMDTDGDGIPDSQDDDIDGDGIPNHLDPDANGDGIPDEYNIDTDGDGIPDFMDDDDDDDGVPDILDRDDDGDGIPDEHEKDTDGDGIRDDWDGDIDGDGIPNHLDSDPFHAPVVFEARVALTWMQENGYLILLGLIAIVSVLSLTSKKDRRDAMKAIDPSQITFSLGNERQ